MIGVKATLNLYQKPEELPVLCVEFVFDKLLTV